MQPADPDVFPDDLSGHFWASLEHDAGIDRWRFSVWDYQGNAMLSGLASSQRQAARIVWAWDAVIVSDFRGNGDPSLMTSPDDA
ncbi:hypothetical protein GCM10009623_20330 [Nocardioides aestuarii]|uniref:Uncharacterized protein n=1 Tax=Nocardioides aestuarii TaxID=252231 RepID=A0ABW4TQ67_9ACTN